MRLLNDEDLESLCGGYFDVNNIIRLIKKQSEFVKMFGFFNEDEQLIGYAGIVLNGGKEFHYKVKKAESFLFDFTVYENFRGRGYAHQILDLISSWLLEKNISNMYLACKTNNINAIKCYERYGFEFVKKNKFLRVLRFNIPALHI
ncbi:MAG: GNAT family N-acetyltransferase [Clostridia bacterium]|nr:GNAT family N-acetyltransferase [Clostridia bacterium]